MTRKIVISLAVLCALGFGVLYANGLLDVHESRKTRDLTPPAPIKALVLEKELKQAPAVSFADIQGGRHALADFKGRYVLLNLWATWCAPCVAELPALATLKLRVPALKVLAVDVYLKDKPADIDAFLKSHKASALGTLTDADRSVSRSFGASSLPVTVLVDPQGRIMARAEGPAEWAAPEAIDYFKMLVNH